MWFYLVMAAAGLLVEGVFWLFGAIPEASTGPIVTTHFAWNYTTFLNIAFLVVFAIIYWLYRTRSRSGLDLAYTIDPVCSMQVEKANAPAHVVHDGTDVWFCSDRCRERYERAISSS